MAVETVTIGGTARIPKFRLQVVGSNPASPDAGYVYVFPKADGLYLIDEDGIVTGPFSAASETLTVWGEVPTGSIDGVNDIYTLANAPLGGTKLRVSINGLIQKLGSSYTISGNTLTIDSASILQTGDELLVDYEHT